MNAAQIVLSAGTFLAALVAAVVSLLLNRSNGARELREEWWRRFQWATELSFDADDSKSVAGIALLRALGDSAMAGKDEITALRAVLQTVLENRLNSLPPDLDPAHTEYVMAFEPEGTLSPPEEGPR